uniref:Secreted protein n=1 Tax=Loa loa TaxID=7209 RepID=A0A1I7V9Q3_LOALO
MLNVSLIRSVLLAAIARSDGFPCGWFSEGVTLDHWRLAQGKPNVFLWLASTGTNQRPVKPFALIELRGQQANNFLSSKIPYQDEIAILSLSYWIVGGPNLEVCLVDSLDKKFNCTAMRIAIIPNKAVGMTAIDDIGYGGTPCKREIPTVIRGCTRLVKSCTKLANVSATHSEINVSGAYLAVFFSRKTVTKNKYQLCAVTALEEKFYTS